MARLSKSEVDKRDKSSPCYYYYKPVSGAEYKGQKVKRKHLCEKCGQEGLIAPQYFWNGRGCQNCSTQKGKNQQFSEEAVQKRDSEAACSHTYPLDPDQPYINQYQKRKHSCLECGHKGEMTAKSFWMGRGCPVCGAKKGSANQIKNASANALEKDKAAKAYKTYPPISDYKGVGVHRLHKCNVCSHIGKMKPDNFWHNGRGCPECGIKLGSSNKRKNMKLQAPERDKKSKCFESYPPISEYIGTFDHRTHQCNICGHKGEMTPNNFWRGRGCPVCADSGFDKTAPAILYYLRVAPKGMPYLYKIGITNRTVKERYNNTDLEIITILKEWGFDKGIDARNQEQKLLKLNSSALYFGSPVLESGNSELFIRDILELDK